MLFLFYILLFRVMAAAVPAINVSTATLCTVARADAAHDYGGELNRDLLLETLPVPASPACENLTDEDNLIQRVLGLTRIPGESRFGDGGFAAVFGREYDIIYANTMDIHGKLSGFFPGDLGLVVDTYSSDFRDFIKGFKAMGGGMGIRGTSYYWIQNKETLYDPAGKTTPITDVGKQLFEGNPKVHFAWENNTRYTGEGASNSFGNVSMYKSCDARIPALNIDDEGNRNTLFYSKYDIIQLLKTSDVMNPPFSSQTENIFAVLTDKSGPKVKQILVNEKAAEKNQALFTIASYRTLSDRYGDIIEGALGNPIAEPSPENYIDIVNKYRYVFKRLGDQGQALSCTRPISVLYKETPIDPILNRKIFNKNVAFVTIDRPALVAAVLYRVPVVIFCFNAGGFAVFINKTYIRPELLLQNSKDNYANIYDKYIQKEQMITKIKKIYPIVESLIYQEIARTIREYSAKLDLYFAKTDEQKDEEYRKFMIDMFMYRYDILNYYKNMILGNTEVFPLPDAINGIGDIIKINKLLEKINREYSRIVCSTELALHTIMRYTFNIEGDVHDYTINIDAEYNSDIEIPLKYKEGGAYRYEKVSIDVFKRASIKRNEDYEQDTLAKEQLSGLTLFQINRGGIASQRLFASFINNTTGLPYIDEYLNALYNYKNDLFIPFKEIFGKLTPHMIYHASDIIKAAGKILIDDIKKNPSVIEYEKISRVSQPGQISGIKRKRGPNNDRPNGEPNGRTMVKRQRQGGGGYDEIIIELRRQEYDAMNNFLTILKRFYTMELRKETTKYTIPIHRDRIIHVDMPLLFINSTLYTIKKYPDLYNKYMLMEHSYNTAYLKIKYGIDYSEPIVHKVESKAPIAYTPGNRYNMSNKGVVIGKKPQSANGRAFGNEPAYIGNMRNEGANPPDRPGRPQYGNRVTHEVSHKLPYVSGHASSARPTAPGGGNNTIMNGTNLGGGSYKPREIKYKMQTKKRKSKPAKTLKKRRI